MQPRHWEGQSSSVWHPSTRLKPEWNLPSSLNMHPALPAGNQDHDAHTKCHPHISKCKPQYKTPSSGRVSAFIQRSLSARHGCHPKCFMHSSKWFLKAAPADFSPYRSLTTSTRFPASSPNYGPSTVQTFSVSGAIRYAFSISAILKSN
jgi:hypothetical protein